LSVQRRPLCDHPHDDEPSLGSRTGAAADDYAAFATRPSISAHGATKSIGFVKKRIGDATSSLWLAAIRTCTFDIMQLIPMDR